MMEVRLLGPMELRTAGRALNLGPPKQRAVFAALVVDAGRPVPVDTLVRRVWDEAPPGEARAALYAHITRLRQVMARAAQEDGRSPQLTHRDGAYLLDVDRDQVDLHRFRRLIEQARGRPDDEQSELLREALGLWRGVPFTGLSGPWVGRLRDSCQRQRLDTVVSWARIELRLGNPEAVIGQVYDLTAEHPLVEPLTAVLMRALYATGHVAEALNCYTSLRRRLAEELGADPGPELQDLHQAILRNDLPPPRPAAAPRTAPAAREVPAQLPVDVRGFTGRANELAQLDAILATAGEQPTAAIIFAVSGTAGVGKTTLAVHWAHRVTDRFPDGQLYVNLRGFDPMEPAMNPAQAVRDFLDAFAVPPERVPVSPDAQAALYRSLLAERRVLVVLDNARDADQVRPLLPGSPGCLIVVTSRDQLTSLVAAEGAHPLTLDLLAPAEARDLLTRRLGADRVAAEPEAASEITTLCARLPLALAIVAARAATHPTFPLSTLAGELRDTHGGLNALGSGDAATDVRAVFSWSYHTLSSDAARLFRLLGLHPGPDIAAPAAASLLASPEGQTRPLLAELARAHLVTEHTPGRYTFHDLLRAYATELAHTLDIEAERQAATHRVLDHYLHTAHAADRLLFPGRDAVDPAPPQAGVAPPTLQSREQAAAWFTGEHNTLLAAVRQAASTGFDAHTCGLGCSVQGFLDRRGNWRDQAAIGRIALAAAQRLGDPSSQARAHRGIGTALLKLGRYDDANIHFRRALDVCGELGDHAGQASAHLGVGWVFELQGNYEGALSHAQQALDLYLAIDDRTGQASALNAIGWCHTQLGCHGRALTNCQQALTLFEELGNRAAQAATWDSLGYIHHHLGHYT